MVYSNSVSQPEGTSLTFIEVWRHRIAWLDEKPLEKSRQQGVQVKLAWPSLKGTLHKFQPRGPLGQANG
jgi:hypothetical protein